MLQVNSVSKAYNTETILQSVSFVLNTGERVGLVGPNGSGKSTLLRLIAGEVRPDSGSVRLGAGDTVAYLPQYPLDELHVSIRDALLRGSGRVGALQTRIQELERGMSLVSGEELEELLQEYTAVQQEFEALGGYELDTRIETVVTGLNLHTLNLNATVATLSGGNKTKLSLARLLLSNASILLLDEPTNYLDLTSLLWLEEWIRRGEGFYLIVSHDRRFLDRTVTSILELDPIKHTLRTWSGNYSEYAGARKVEDQKQLAAYLDHQAERRRIEDDIRRTKEQARGVERGTQLDTTRRYAKKVAAKAKAREHRLERMLEENEVEKPRRSWGLHLADLGASPIDDDRTVLSVTNVQAGYNGLEVLRGVNLTLRGRDRTALLGSNGTGKSTLLRCVTGDIPFQGSVKLGANVRIGFLSQEGDELPHDQTVFDAFRSRTLMYEDEARTYLHKFLFTGDEVFKPVRMLSYGQRAKLALAILMLGGANFLVLDEPTSHMDMPALEAIEEALSRYQGPLLVVSHDRYFLERVGINRTLVLEHDLLRESEDLQVLGQKLSTESEQPRPLATEYPG